MIMTDGESKSLIQRYYSSVLMTTHIDENRHIRGIYNGLNLASVKQLIADIKTLKKES